MVKKRVRRMKVKKKKTPVHKVKKKVKHKEPEEDVPVAKAHMVRPPDDEEDLGLAKTITAPPDEEDLGLSKTIEALHDDEEPLEMEEIIEADAVDDEEPEDKPDVGKPSKFIKEMGDLSQEEEPPEEEEDIPPAEEEPEEEELEEEEPPEEEPEKPQPPDTGDEDILDDFHASTEATLELQEQVLLELENELFEKEQEVREEIQAMAEKNPEEMTVILETVKTYDDETIKDFVEAAETLYDGRIETLPGDEKIWGELREKAESVEREVEGEIPVHESKTEMVARRTRAIEIFKQSLKPGDTKEEREDPLAALRMRAEGDKSTSHFFGPKIATPELERKKSKSMTDLIKVGEISDSVEEEMGGHTRVDLAQEISELREQMKTKEKELEDYKASTKAHTSEKVEDMYRLLKEANNKIAELEKQNLALGKKQDATDRSTLQVHELNKAVEAMRDQIETKDGEIDRLKEELKIINEEIAEGHDGTTPLKVDERKIMHAKAEIELNRKELEKEKEKHARNLEELKEIARENMKAEYRLQRKEVLLEELEKDLNTEKKNIEKANVEIERLNNEMKVKEEVLDKRENEIVTKEEDINLKLENLEKEMKKIKQEQKTIKDDLKEKMRIDYRNYKKSEELGKWETELKRREDVLSRAEVKMVEGTEGIDPSKLDEVIKMKSLELAEKEESIKEKEDDLAAKEQMLAKRLAMAEEGATGDEKEIARRESEMIKKERELARMENLLKEKWDKLQKAAEGRVEGEGKPVLKVRCGNCKSLISVYEKSRPLKVVCQSCGKVGQLK